MNIIARLKRLTRQLHHRHATFGAHRAEPEDLQAYPDIRSVEVSASSPEDIDAPLENEVDVPIITSITLPAEPASEGKVVHSRHDSGIEPQHSHLLSAPSSNSDAVPAIPMDAAPALDTYICEATWPHICMPKHISQQQARYVSLHLHFARANTRRRDNEHVKAFRDNKRSYKMRFGHEMGNGRSLLSQEIKPEDID
jgi:hypothetical protein